jgi:hypothetical protein
MATFSEEAKQIFLKAHTRLMNDMKLFQSLQKKMEEKIAEDVQKDFMKVHSIFRKENGRDATDDEVKTWMREITKNSELPLFIEEQVEEAAQQTQEEQPEEEQPEEEQPEEET